MTRPVAFVLRIALLLLAKTWRLKHFRVEPSEAPGSLRVLWHGHQLPPIYSLRHQALNVLISHSRDGQLLSNALKPLGYKIVRGSSSKGGSKAYEELLQLLKAGENAVIAADGPRGPRGKSRYGAARLGLESDSKVIPMAVAASHRIELKSWDQFMIPLPFSRVIVYEGQAVSLVPGDIVASNRRVERAIDDCAKHSKKQLLGGPSLGLSALYYVFQLLVYLLLPIIVPILVCRKRWRQGLFQRLGFPGKGSAQKPSALGHLHFHGASLGEAKLAQNVARGLATSYECHLTVNSPEALKVQQECGLWTDVKLAPVDLPGPVKRHYGRSRPVALFILEGELWPWRWWEARRLGIPIIWLNARISHESASKWRRLSKVAHTMGQGVEGLYPRSAADGARIETIFDLSQIPGRLMDLKMLAAPEPIVSPELLPWCRGDVWIAGSVHGPEIRPVLEAHEKLLKDLPNLKLVIAPRRISSSEQILKDCHRMGLMVVKRSQLPQLERAPSVLVLDSFGELAALYAYAKAAFVGGTFVAVGGHSPFEALSAGCPVVIGPRHGAIGESLESIPHSLLQLINEPRDLGQGIDHFLKNPPETEDKNRGGFQGLSLELHQALKRLPRSIST